MKKVRHTIFLHPSLSEMLSKRAAEEFMEPPELIRQIVSDHLKGRCGREAPGPRDPSGSERGRGRPKGGSAENEATYLAIHEGNPEGVLSELVRCGFLPLGARETVEGDPGHFRSGKWNALMDDPLKEIEHVIEPNPEVDGEITYTIVQRSWRNPEADPDESVSVRALSRGELWNLVKKEI